MIRGRIVNNRGTSFVEMLLATLILLIVIVGIITLFSKSTVMANQIREHAIVNSTLNERMEEIRNMDYDDILTLPTTFSTTGFNQIKNAAGSMTLTDSFSNANIRKVTLTVTWTSSSGRSENRSLVCFVTKEGINRQ